MENRFLEMDTLLSKTKSKTDKKAALDVNGLANPHGFSLSKSNGFAQTFTAQTRVLVILIENGGVDLGIPALVDKIISALHISSIIPNSAKQALVSSLRTQILSLTDSVAEGVELAINRYTNARPDFYGNVMVLRNSTASYNDLKTTLIGQSRDNKLIDLLILTHGSGDFISVTGGINGQKIRDIRTEYGRPLSIRSVYMMNCVGSSLNQAWIDAGAKVSSGALRNNYLPEPSTHFFWNNWKEGQSFENAVTGAYRRTVSVMNTAINTALGQIPFFGPFINNFNVETLDFVQASAPVIQGQRTVTINADDLTFAMSQSSSLATTILPLSVLQSLGSSSAFTNERHSTWAMSDQCVALIKRFEGFRANMYNDPVGHCTIGYGTLLHKGNCNGAPSEAAYTAGITEQRATELLREKANEFQRTINDGVNVELNQNQYDSLVSFTYNIGSGAFMESTLLRELNAGNYTQVPTEIKKWVKGRDASGALITLPGLVTRRNEEAALFSTPISAAQSFSFSVGANFSTPFGAVNYTIGGSLPEIRQPSGLTCWAAVMTMMISWKNNRVYSIRDALATIGTNYVQMFERGDILTSEIAARLYTDARLTPITSFNPSIDGWVNLLRQYGPLYVDIGYASSSNTHAVIVKGLVGDGTAERTNITYVDPAEGRSITVSFRTFLTNYEAPGAVNNWPYTIVHWPSAISGSQSINQNYLSKPFYDTGEHNMMGEFINNATSGPIASTHALQPTTLFPINGVQFTYGQIMTMGDFYNTYTDLQAASTAQLTGLKTLITRSENHYKNSILHIGSPAADVTNAEWGRAVPSYITLAIENNSHFGPPASGTTSTLANNKQMWESYHARAIAIARAGVNSTALDAAYPVNAFGDHFLTDAFSAGHLINKEFVMNRFISNTLSGSSVNAAGDGLFTRVAAGALAIPTVRAKLARYELTETHLNVHLNLDTTFPVHVFYRVLKGIMEDTAAGGARQIANLSAKAIHDYLNTYTSGGVAGVPVTNNKGNSWKCTGDGTLNLENLQLIQLAIKQSVENIEDSVRNPTTPVATFFTRVWDYLPNLTNAATRAITDNAINVFTDPASPLLSARAVILIDREIDTLLGALLSAGKIRLA